MVPARLLRRERMSRWSAPSTGRSRSSSSWKSRRAADRVASPEPAVIARATPTGAEREQDSSGHSPRSSTIDSSTRRSALGAAFERAQLARRARASSTGRRSRLEARDSCTARSSDRATCILPVMSRARA